MSAATTPDARLLLFEVAGCAWALPITGVVEVTEVERLFSVPTLPARVGGVVNFHGDALPVIRASFLLDVDDDGAAPSGTVLAVAHRPTEKARLGVPVERVLGLCDGVAVQPARGSEPVVDRRSIEGRVTRVLDPGRLVERARALIEQGSAGPGGETRLEH